MGRVGLTNERLAIWRTLAMARAIFAVAIQEQPTGRLMIRSRTQVVKRQPDGAW